MLAASFFIVFADANNVPTDIDHNGKPDLAVVETLYHDNVTQFTWRINANIDVQSVALHEAGHALGLDHFGALFQTDANGMFHYAPNAVMNASYTGVKQSLLPTDVSGYCSLWASWPNR